MLETYDSRFDELDAMVRTQLASWFPNHDSRIMNEWQLKAIYKVNNAQPSQYRSPHSANVNGGRACNEFKGAQLPSGFFLCGDYMATSTLNGAIESGVNVGKVVANEYLNSV